jgi:acetyl-CoA synthetase
MAADRAEQHQVPLPQPPEALRELLVSRIPEFGAARNPCDVTGQILNDPESINVCAGGFLGDPHYAALIVPMTYGYPASVERIPVYDNLASQHGKVVCIAWQTEWLEGPGVREVEQSENVALFRSVNSLFAALKSWTWRAEKRRFAEPAAASTSAETLTRASAMLSEASGKTLTEREAKTLLALYGVPVVGETLARSEEEAVNAAGHLGYPVVMKLESPDVPHKTEAGVICLNLHNADDARAAYQTIIAKTQAISPPPRVNGVLVQPMVSRGIEMVIGARVDALFGPQVVLRHGGILVQVLKDTANAPAPETNTLALALLRT